MCLVTSSDLRTLAVCVDPSCHADACSITLLGLLTIGFAYSFGIVLALVIAIVSDSRSRGMPYH